MMLLFRMLAYFLLNLDWCHVKGGAPYITELGCGGLMT